MGEQEETEEEGKEGGRVPQGLLERTPSSVLSPTAPPPSTLSQTGRPSISKANITPGWLLTFPF